MPVCDLERIYGAVRRQMNRAIAKGKPFSFSVANLPAPPEKLASPHIVCRKGFHHYHASNRVDMIQVFADQPGMQLLGLWLLSMLMHPLPSSSQLDLPHRASQIRRMKCDFMHGGSYWGVQHPGYVSVPSRYRHEPDLPLKRFPFLEVEIPGDLPAFRLTNDADMVVSEAEFQQRDTIFGFGNDVAVVRLASLLLDLGHPASKDAEVDLEGELGYRGVAPGSVEVQFVLPGTFRWVDFPAEDPLVMD